MNDRDDFPNRYKQAVYDEAMYSRWQALIYVYFLEHSQLTEEYAAICERLMPLYIGNPNLSEAYRLLNEMTSVVIDAIGSPEWQGYIDQYDHRQALNSCVQAAYDDWIKTGKLKL